MYTLIGAVIGAALAACIAFVNTNRLIRKDEKLANREEERLRRQDLTERSAALIAATYHAVLSLRDLALAEPDEKAAIEKSDVWPTVDPVNRALSAVRINDPDDLVQAAEAIDQALIVLARQAREHVFTHEEWRRCRAEHMADKPGQAITVARRYTRSEE